MPLDREAERRVMDAMGEAIQLLERADRSVKYASSELHGDLLDLATRMSRHVRFLKEVCELLCHETAQQRGRPDNVVALPAKAVARRLPAP